MHVCCWSLNDGSHKLRNTNYFNFFISIVKFENFFLNSRHWCRFCKILVRTLQDNRIFTIDHFACDAVRRDRAPKIQKKWKQYLLKALILKKVLFVKFPLNIGKYSSAVNFLQNTLLDVLSIINWFLEEELFQYNKQLSLKVLNSFLRLFTLEELYYNTYGAIRPKINYPK